MENNIIIQTLARSGKSRRQIAAMLGISRHAVHRAINDAGDSSPGKGKASKLTVYRQQVLSWLEESRLSARLIYERLLGMGLEVSYPTVSRYIKSLKQQEVYVPVVTDPGQEAQVDFGYLGYFYRGSRAVRVWVFCMVLSYSRYAYYREVTDQQIGTFLRCHMEAFEFFGGVPLTIKIDNLKAGVLKADFYEPVIQHQYRSFLSHYKAAPVTARIRRGQDKGKVESGVKFVKNNFLKSLEHRDFHRLSSELRQWNKGRCNLRVHGTTRKVPWEQFTGVEKQYLQQLPPVRYQFTDFQDRKVGWYGHILYQYNYYSVPSELAGQTMQVESNGSVLRISHHGKIYAVHVLHHGVGEFITQESHKPRCKQVSSPDYYREQVQAIGPSAVKVLEGMQQRQPHHWHPMARGIVALRRDFPADVIEKACAQALRYNACTYQSVRNICENGPLQRPPVAPSRTPLGGYNHDLQFYDKLGKT